MAEESKFRNTPWHHISETFNFYLTIISFLLWIAPLLKVDQTELVNVLKTVLDGFDSTNAYLRQNIPGLVEETKKIQELKETLP